MFLQIQIYGTVSHGQIYILKGFGAKLCCWAPSAHVLIKKQINNQNEIIIQLKRSEKLE